MLKFLSFFKLETGFVLLLLALAGAMYPHWSNNSANGPLITPRATATTAPNCPRINVHDSQGMDINL